METALLPEVFVWQDWYIFSLYWQILMRDSKGISDDQMKEFRTSFNFFDKVNIEYE